MMKQIRVLLCQPIPTENSPQKNPPLGIMFTGAAAERAGFEVEYWDERWDGQAALRKAMQWADIVGVSSFTGIQLKYARRILIEAKRMGKITVIGGVHANLTSDQCFAEDCIDYVAIGEGEITLPSLLVYLSGGIPPIGIKGKDIIYCPAPQLTSKEFISPITEKTMRFFELANETNDIMLPSSRGCPYRCGFCVNSLVQERKYRMVELATWVGWLDQLASRMSIRWIQVGDDYLGTQKRILQVGNALKQRGVKWHPSFRADNFKKNGLQFALQLKELGMTDVAIGVETGSERMMAFIDKDETKDDVLHAARCLATTGIRPRYYFIVGFPTETSDEMMETLDFADELCSIHRGNCNIPIYNFTPFPGATLFDVAVAEGMRIPKRMEEWETFTVSNSGSAEMQNLYHIAGFHFHQQQGSKTDLNFPGKRRWIIRPFEMLCDLRWRLRFFLYFGLEKLCIEFILKHFRKR